MLLGNLAVAPDALSVIVKDPIRTERLCHRTFGLSVVAQHFFQPVLSLGVTGGERSAGGSRSEDMRHAVFVA